MLKHFFGTRDKPVSGVFEGPGNPTVRKVRDTFYIEGLVAPVHVLEDGNLLLPVMHGVPGAVPYYHEDDLTEKKGREYVEFVKNELNNRI